MGMTKEMIKEAKAELTKMFDKYIQNGGYEEDFINVGFSYMANKYNINSDDDENFELAEQIVYSIIDNIE